MEAGAEAAEGLEQHGLTAEGEAVGAEHGDDGDKPLTSKYRGVCWNKKNRRSDGSAVVAVQIVGVGTREG